MKHLELKREDQKKQEISIIVAMDQNGAIGKYGCIPWKIKGEQQQFKELTTNNIVIMGRKTYEEIGKPLPDRFTIVISSTKKYEDDNLATFKTLEDALEFCKYMSEKDVYIAGGAALYKEGLLYADKLFITFVDKQYTVEEPDAVFEKEWLYELFTKTKVLEIKKNHFERTLWVRRR